MTNRTFFLSLGAGLAMFAMGCSADEVTEANNNPNDPTDAPSEALFTNAARNGVSRWVDGLNGTRYGFLPQHFAEVQYPDDDQYLSARLGAAATSGLFNGSYNTELQDLRLVIDRGTAASLPGLSGPAQVLSQWEFGILTDVFGDVPYSETFDPTILKPKYDGQRAIYTGLFTALNSASDALATATNELGSGDPIFGGDPVGWRKFANSLRLRHALRIANTGVAADLADAAAQVTAAAAAAEGGLIDDNAENAQMVWPGDGVYDNPWANNFKSRDDYRISSRLMTWWAAHADPRISVLAQPVTVDLGASVAGRTVRYCPTGAAPCYAGLVNALTQATASPYVPNTSRPGLMFFPTSNSYGAPGGTGLSHPSRLFTAAETEFLLAEAAQRGIGTVTGTAAQHYINGITRHMEMVGVPAAAIATYLARPEIVYTPGTAGLIQIAEQKWMALYTDQIQAWAEVRRTCQPAFVEPGPNARFAQIPRRFQYSTTDKAVNGSMYTAALTSLTPASDVMTARFYWDKNTFSAAANPTYVAGCSDRLT